jgi:hypothetical protein
VLISYWIHNVLDVQSELEEHLWKQHFLANTWDFKGILQRNEDTYYLYSIPLGLWYGFPLLFCVGCSRWRPLFILLRSFGISGLVIWSAVTRTNGVVVVLGFSYTSIWYGWHQKWTYVFELIYQYIEVRRINNLAFGHSTLIVLILIAIYH